MIIPWQVSKFESWLADFVRARHVVFSPQAEAAQYDVGIDATWQGRYITLKDQRGGQTLIWIEVSSIRPGLTEVSARFNDAALHDYVTGMFDALGAEMERIEALAGPQKQSTTAQAQADVTTAQEDNKPGTPAQDRSLVDTWVLEAIQDLRKGKERLTIKNGDIAAKMAEMGHYNRKTGENYSEVHVSRSRARLRRQGEDV